MKKKLFYSAAVLGAAAVLSVPLMGFSWSAPATKIQPNKFTLQSGGTSVPYSQMANATFYHQPVDGIISAAAGCAPDIHVFDKNATAKSPTGATEPAHIVFTAGISQFKTRDEAAAFDASGGKIYVEVVSNNLKVLSQALYLHPGVDPNTNKPFWVTAVWLGGEKSANLPTGDYNYVFIAKDKNGHIVSVWTPKNHKFTITSN